MSSVPHRPPRSAVQRTADTLREQILASGDGTLLGSEEDLLRRLSVSRPTLRQSARLLEHEQLLRVRRGVNGGYYARHPEVGAVAQMAAVTLRMRGTTLRETFASAAPLMAEALRRAAITDDRAARAKFEAALQRFAPASQEPSTRTMLRDEAEFVERVLDLAANPPIELFLRVLFEFGLSETNALLFANHPERVREWIVIRDRIAQAITERDAELVVLLARRRSECVEGWLDLDLGAQADNEIDRAKQGLKTATNK